MFQLGRGRPHDVRHVTRVLVSDPCGRWHTRLWVYIVREHERGRQLSEILGDRFVREHASVSAITHLLEDPAFVRRLGAACTEPLAEPEKRARTTGRERG